MMILWQEAEKGRTFPLKFNVNIRNAGAKREMTGIIPTMFYIIFGFLPKL
jgi:hypothetical protein